MLTLSQLQTLLGWCLVIHLVMLTVTAVLVVAVRPLLLRIHASLTGLTETQILPMYFRFIAYYKMLVVVFFLVPYIGLLMMT
ncbi:DUF6868 family protein [Alteromonas halophila]|uniref:DUF6868 domain-containing protein n=1 Tax=Alteromonas halophila TaxID=516698 RepID=A0A918JJX0_9ALTE|nr:hypothetical protein [Alteromonas halophila]GGW79544.1 hypothetical protein GCM10007391_10420 [Alteromonas halophila]